jgi:hypothetical protein
LGWGSTGDRFVHRVVEDFGGEVVQRVVIGAADIHTGAAADGLEAFEDLDVLGGICLLAPPGLRRAEQIVHAVFP